VGIFPPDPKWSLGSLLHGIGGLVVIFGSPMVFIHAGEQWFRAQ
jgi:hypothetical protein